MGRLHPQEIKLTHWFPSILVLGVISVLLMAFFNLFLFKIGVSGLILYFVALFLHSLKVNRNLKVALLTLPSALVQLGGYGLGFLTEKIKPNTS